MIKACALKPVTAEAMKVSEVLTKSSQNIKIEYSQSADMVPRSVENLAYKMLQMDSDIRGILNDLRVLYVSKREDFHLSMNGLTKKAKADVIELFQNLYGVIAEVHYCPDCDILNGKLIFSSRAQRFITGEYMEIAIRKVVSDVLGKLEVKHGKQFKLYSNVKVATMDGNLKNEFDLVIENETDSIIYVLEVKSGKNFRDFDKLARIGREYEIVPNRLLLIDNYLSEEQMEIIEYFCEYYVANLEQNNLESKIVTMLENDL